MSWLKAYWPFACNLHIIHGPPISKNTEYQAMHPYFIEFMATGLSSSNDTWLYVTTNEIVIIIPYMYMCVSVHNYCNNYISFCIKMRPISILEVGPILISILMWYFSSMWHNVQIWDTVPLLKSSHFSDQSWSNIGLPFIRQ